MSRQSSWQCVVVVAGVVFAASPGRVVDAQPEGKVRAPSGAGSWYPGDPAELAKQVEGLLGEAPAPNVSGKPLAVISPHAGYRWAGRATAAGFRCLQGHTYKRVIVLAFSHHYSNSYQGVDVPAELTAYSTPLGAVSIDREACDALLQKPGFASHPGVDRDEWSLENQLPFLQKVLGEFRLVPLLVGRMSDHDHARAAEAILPLFDDDTLLVASSDFTHYGAYYGYAPFKEEIPTKLRELADQAAVPIVRCDYDGFVAHLTKTGDTICGRGAIKLLLRVVSMRGGAAGARAGIQLFGEMTGDWSRSVTYQSFVFTRRSGRVGEKERAQLLRLARGTVVAVLKGHQPPEVDAGALPDRLREDGACFVTLQNQGRLRGCIGNMVADGPLYQAVIRNAVSACQDYRFVNDPVTADELDALEIEISCLTPMKPVVDTEQIIVGSHGLLVSLGGRRGVLLPQVAYQRGWTREKFLAQTCRKAGLAPQAWKRPEAELYSFEAEVFAEPR